MRAGRHLSAGGPQAARWPFAVHEVRTTPLIAPEFRSSFHRILSTTRFYFHIEDGSRREQQKRDSHRR
jgi:hypothetical protein